MKNFVVTVCALIAVLFASKTVMAQDAVQWTEAEGGNGHWYAIRPLGQVWSVARSNCASIGGHLATITSVEEDDFLKNMMLEDGLSSTYQIGGFQSSTNDEPGGNWRWVTDEPMVYVNWNPDAPDNGGTSSHEHYLNYNFDFDGGCMADCICDCSRPRKA